MTIALFYVAFAAFMACGPKYPEHQPSDTESEETGELSEAETWPVADCGYATPFVEIDQDVGLGYTGADAIAELSGAREVVMDWLYWEEQSLLQMTLTLEEEGVQFYEALEDGCEDYLLLYGTLSMHTDDLWLEETLDVEVRLMDVDRASIRAAIPYEEMIGAYTPAEELNKGEGDYWFNLSAETGPDGEVGGIILNLGRDTNNNPIIYIVGCWGPDGCV